MLFVGVQITFLWVVKELENQRKVVLERKKAVCFLLKIFNSRRVNRNINLKRKLGEKEEKRRRS